jgi:hypothetical protein
MKKQSYYIGWQHNPQLPNGGYYKAYGQLSLRDAKRKEKNCLSGTIQLTAYSTEEAYQSALTEHAIAGYSIYGQTFAWTTGATTVERSDTEVTHQP